MHGDVDTALSLPSFLHQRSCKWLLSAGMPVPEGGGYPGREGVPAPAPPPRRSPAQGAPAARGAAPAQAAGPRAAVPRAVRAVAAALRRCCPLPNLHVPDIPAPEGRTQARACVLRYCKLRHKPQTLSHEYPCMLQQLHVHRRQMRSTKDLPILAYSVRFDTCAPQELHCI